MIKRFTKKGCIGLALALGLLVTVLNPATGKAADAKKIALKTEYSETNDDTWNFDSATNNMLSSSNCRVVTVKSAGRMKVSGSANSDIRIYLYNQYGAKEIVNRSTGSGQFSVIANISKGKHYLKFWATDGGAASINYKVTFSKNKIYKNSKKALKFNKYNKEYLRGCTFESASSNRKASANCRKIVVPGKRKLKLAAYTLGESNSDVRVYIYKSDGKAVLSNWQVKDGKKYKTITLKKGTYYMKFWECFGENAEFHYRLKLKKK